MRRAHATAIAANQMPACEVRVIKIWRGNAWQPSEVIDELRKAAKP